MRLGPNHMLCVYKSSVYYIDNIHHPNNSAVQISAAITANARIHMYPYISREDCYYTDTDSVFLKNPLTDVMKKSPILNSGSFN